ncbi:hypothetical protein BDN71DRAFT_1431663 [Pleurotus eryngii]|uniref:Uncharacterized protein n=1 Tax=Pleurotus eryngii TaxID=5323 RepID=A0A9P5ZV73_PLEER|nr:hypothetical protein BDN71DRAFT_1431663 [Pleurotus eryngii]
MHIYIKGMKSQITDVQVWPNGGAMTAQDTSLIEYVKKCAGWAATYAPGPYTSSCGYHCFSQECPHRTQTLADEVYSTDIEPGKGNHKVYCGMTYVCTVDGAVAWQFWMINPLTVGYLSDNGSPGRPALDAYQTMAVLDNMSCPRRHALDAYQTMAVLDNMSWCPSIDSTSKEGKR